MIRRLLAVSMAALTTPLPAQDIRPDTSPSLGAIVILAERSATPINRSAAAVTRLTAADLARLPDVTVADVLRRVPGFAVVDFDGSGRDPQLMVRGFYGGGEAEYVVVMIDGRRANQEHNGTIAWESLPPLTAIESIEIVRGSASSLHGDAAVAGVINIVTRGLPDRPASWRLLGESSGGVAASADLAGPVNHRDATASIGFDRTQGFRDHSSRTSATARGMMSLSRTLTATLGGAWRDFQEPGPLLESLLVDGSESDPRFGDDGGHDREWNAEVRYNGSLGAGGTVQTTVRTGRRTATLIRTLPLAPDFGDTRERELRATNVGLTTQADLNSTILPIERMSVGASVDLGDIDSRYYSTADDGTRGLDASGDGGRLALGAFAHLVNSPTDWLRWTLGVRLDRLADNFGSDSGDSDAAHFAFTPKGGLNIRYAATGHAWLSVSRTFKAPTLDQLFDQRPIPLPFPPFSITTSNADLKPQRGTSLEGGLFHEAALGSARLGATLTVYQVAMRDELDFDVQALTYVNIGRSRHRGAEAGLTLSGTDASGFVSLTRQDVIARSGDNAGHQLKAIPGQLLSAGITAHPSKLGTISVSATRTADMFIDDANTRRIPSWTRVDAQISRSLRQLEVILGARNLFDARINSTAFLDPSGSGLAYYYPAAGRVFTLGVRRGR